LALGVLWVCGLLAFFGLAVLVASRTARPAVGQGLINAVTLPMFVVSGVFFGLDNLAPFCRGSSGSSRPPCWWMPPAR